MSDVRASQSTNAEPLWITARRQKMLSGLNLSCTRGIEIGPLSTPLVRKSEADVRYVDHVDQATLKAKYAADPNVNVANIVDVDAVWSERTLAECFPDESGFDYVVASHVLEHVPDMIGWLGEIAQVLRPGGHVYLAVPDKRFTFDYFRRTSSLAEVIGAYLCRSRRPTPAQVFDQNAYRSEVDAPSAWSGPPDSALHMSMAKLHQALGVATLVAGQPQYLDVHCWVFTPRSLLETMVALIDLGLLSFQCVEFRRTAPSDLEMFLVLETVDTSDAAIKTAARESFLTHLEQLPRTEPDSAASTDEPSLAASLVAPAKPSMSREGSASPRAWRVAAGRLRWAARKALPARLFAPRCPLIARAQAVPSLDVLGHEFPAYERTFDFAGDFIDEDHRAIAALPTEGGLVRIETPGFLRSADALALYELAYFAGGDVLELGSAWGLSTRFLCQAAFNAGRGALVVSIEIRPDYQQATQRTIHDLGLGCCYRGIVGDADEVTGQLIARGRTFGFVFVDLDHTYGVMRRLCGRLPTLLRPGGMALFHDFNDERNVSDPDSYAVYPAVVELLMEQHMVFLGMIGCCALLHKPAAIGREPQ